MPEEIPPSDPWAKVGEAPQGIRDRHDPLHLLWLVRRVCPEQAIFLKKEYSITGYTRKEMVNNKEKLLEMGGVMEGLVYK